MTWSRTPSPLFSMLAVLITLALASVGFGHNLGDKDSRRLALSVAAISLSPADICGDSPADDGGGCGVCRLIASVDVPPPAIGPVACVLRALPVGVPEDPATVTPFRRCHIHAARAPPVSV